MYRHTAPGVRKLIGKPPATRRRMSVEEMSIAGTETTRLAKNLYSSGTFSQSSFHPGRAMTTM